MTLSLSLILNSYLITGRGTYSCDPNTCSGFPCMGRPLPVGVPPSYAVAVIERWPANMLKHMLWQTLELT